MKFDELFKDIQEIYTEAKEAPKGKHYTKRGALRSGDADADGDGGPKYRSDPTYKNPNEDAETFGSAMRSLDKISGEQEADELYGAIHAEVEGGKSVEEVLKGMNYPEQSHKVMSISYKNWLASKGEGGEDPVDVAHEKGHIAGDDVRMIKNLRDDEDAEGQSLADDFMEFASLVSAAEQGREVDIDKLRIELNALDERLEALKSEESEETFDQLYDRYVTTNEEDAERVDKDRMKCNSPRRTSGGSKKFVVKACKDGKEKVVRFGDPNMKIKKSNPKRRKSFRARHKCDQKKDKFSAGYWSCKKW